MTTAVKIRTDRPRRPRAAGPVPLRRRAPLRRHARGRPRRPSFCSILITCKVIAGARPAMRLLRPRIPHGDDLEPCHRRLRRRHVHFRHGDHVDLALLIAAPISIAIALFLTEFAPGGSARPVGALVEMLASVPSVVLGLWGILVMGPGSSRQLEPVPQHGSLGWTPFFDGEQTVGSSQLAAILILTIMVVPIISSISRELFIERAARP